MVGQRQLGGDVVEASGAVGQAEFEGVVVALSVKMAEYDVINALRASHFADGEFG